MIGVDLVTPCYHTAAVFSSLLARCHGLFLIGCYLDKVQVYAPGNSLEDTPIICRVVRLLIGSGCGWRLLAGCLRRKYMKFINSPVWGKIWQAPSGGLIYVGGESFFVTYNIRNRYTARAAKPALVQAQLTLFPTHVTCVSMFCPAVSCSLALCHATSIPTFVRGTAEKRVAVFPS